MEEYVRNANGLVIDTRKIEQIPSRQEESHLMDSGMREHLETGAMREPSIGKGRFDLLPPAMLMRVAQHYENGAKKYAERNWEKGIPASRCFSSAIRHLFKWLAGSTEEDHLAAAIWNIACLIQWEDVMPEMMDIPTRPQFGRDSNGK
jgi:hypothetical protein